MKIIHRGCAQESAKYWAGVSTEYVCQTHCGKIIRKHLEQNISLVECKSHEFRDVCDQNISEDSHNNNNARNRSNVLDASGPTSKCSKKTTSKNKEQTTAGEPTKRTRPQRNRRPLVRYQ